MLEFKMFCRTGITHLHHNTTLVFPKQVVWSLLRPSTALIVWESICFSTCRCWRRLSNSPLRSWKWSSNRIWLTWDCMFSAWTCTGSWGPRWREWLTSPAVNYSCLSRLCLVCTLLCKSIWPSWPNPGENQVRTTGCKLSCSSISWETCFRSMHIWTPLIRLCRLLKCQSCSRLWWWCRWIHSNAGPGESEALRITSLWRPVTCANPEGFTFNSKTWVGRTGSLHLRGIWPITATESVLSLWVKAWTGPTTPSCRRWSIRLTPQGLLSPAAFRSNWPPSPCSITTITIMWFWDIMKTWWWMSVDADELQLILNAEVHIFLKHVILVQWSCGSWTLRTWWENVNAQVM